MSNSGIDVSNLITSWNNFAHTYDRRLGGSTKAVARHIISHFPPLDGSHLVLDNCCGTGAFTLELHYGKRPGPLPFVHAVDKSLGMIEIMQSLIAKNKWQESVRAESMDSEKLMFPNNTFDISVTSFGIFFFPDPIQGAKEIFRTLKPGGVAYVTCWKEIIFVPIFYEVQKIVHPAKNMVLHMLETWRNRETLEETMKKGGFSQLEIEVKDVMIVQKDMEELVDSLAIHLQDIVGEEWTEKEKEQIKQATKTVVTEQRETFVVDLDDGSKVGLPMCAWIAKGVKT